MERTQAGKAVARQDPNFREGRPKKYLPTQLQHALELLDSGKTYRQVEALTGISRSTLIGSQKTKIPPHGSEHTKAWWDALKMNAI